MMFKETPLDEALAPLAREFCKDREEAIRDRAARGLDRLWARAREQRAGIDETNRDRMSPIDGKATTLDGPVYVRTPLGKVEEETRSTVFVNITRPYANAGISRVTDIILPTGKMPWELKLSPRRDSQTILETLSSYPKQLAQVMQLVPELAVVLQQDEEAAEAALEVAKEQIKDWQKESDWTAELRKVITEAGNVGTGVLKGPFSKRRRISASVEALLSAVPLAFVEAKTIGTEVQEQLESRLRFAPRSECVKVENCYPAPDCGEDIQNGEYFFERIPDTSKRKLEDLKDDPSYFPEQIDACLREGPRDIKGRKQRKGRAYDLWVRTGAIALDSLVEPTDSEGCPPSLSIFGAVVMCNDRIIKIDHLPVGNNTFPYRFFRWEPRENSWDGIGIVEQMETTQRGLNAAVRSLMDNMGYSVGPQILEVEGILWPKEGDDAQLRPYKRWKVSVGLPGMGSLDDPTKAMTFLEFPNYLNEILPVIEFWMKRAEDTTGLPLLLQGQPTTSAVGISQQLMSNTTTNLRSLVREVDHKVIKPNLDDYYEWCQIYGPKSARGDAEVVPLGSSVLLVKELQMQALLQIGDRVLQPIYGKSPAKWMDMFLEGNQIDPENLDLTDEERQQLEAAEQQPDPKVVAAQIQAQGNMMIAQIKDATDQLKVFVDAEAKGASILQARDAVETQAAANIAQESMKQEGTRVKEEAESQVEDGSSLPIPIRQAPASSPTTDDEVLAQLGLG